MSTPERHVRLHQLQLAAGLLALGMAIAVISGWALGIRSLQSFVPGWVTMKPNAALALALAACTLLLIARRAHGYPSSAWARALSMALGALVAAIGLGTFAEYAFVVDLGIDQAFFDASNELAASSTPGRMAVVTAVAFALLGSALALAARCGHVARAASQLLALGTGATALAALLGHLYGVIPLVGQGHGIQIAAHTALGILLLSTATLSLDTSARWLGTLLSRHPGGVLARRLLPVALGVPMALGALRLTGEWFHISGPASASATVAVVTMFAFALFIWTTARGLNEAELRWRTAEDERVRLALREAEAQARAAAESAGREAAEGNVRQKEEALAVLDVVLESTPIAFALFDAELRFVRVNAAMTTFTGRPASAHLGRTTAEIAPGLADAIESPCRQVMTTGVPMVNVENSRVTPAVPDKARHWLTSAYPVRAGNGKTVGTGVMMVETTDRKRLEAQLQQSQKMEAVGQLAGGVAHDFNNILTAIKSFSELLAGDLPADSPLRGDVGEISAAADRATALTRHLLAFSRRQTLQPVVLDTNEVITGTLNLLARLIGPDIRCEPLLSRDTGRILADRGQLEQVLVNLAVNARDAMPDGGRLTIETANVSVDERHAVRLGGVEPAIPGDYVMLAVNDTGTGMDAATQARIFEPFFTTKEPGKGTGLGLATVYGIVRQSRGFVTVYSEVGRGTTFRIYLPRALGDITPARCSPNAPLPVAAPTEMVLVVDDDPSVLTVAARVLARGGYRVVTASSAAEAEAEMARNAEAIDLVITDLVMPDTNGAELVRRLLGRCPRLRVLFTSGYTEAGVMHRGLIGPGAHFIAKPFSIDDLLRKVREALVTGPAGSLRSE